MNDPQVSKKISELEKQKKIQKIKFKSKWGGINIEIRDTDSNISVWIKLKEDSNMSEIKIRLRNQLYFDDDEVFLTKQDDEVTSFSPKELNFSESAESMNGRCIFMKRRKYPDAFKIFIYDEGNSKFIEKPLKLDIENSHTTKWEDVFNICANFTQMESKNVGIIFEDLYVTS